MSLKEPRCMVCGAPLDPGAIFNEDPRISEVCSDECYRVFMNQEADNE